MENFMKHHKEKVEGKEKKKEMKGEEKGGPKMPPSTLIDVVLDIVQNTYWEAKRLSGEYMICKIVEYTPVS